MAGLPPFVEGLLKPEAYPHKPKKVELVQTQISFVFLAGDLVYKVKKPVDFGFLDFTSLEKRRFFCEQEVTLNSRLCPGTYLGVVKVCQDGASFSVEKQGKAVEYAVKMRQLPRERMMDYLVRRGDVTPEMVQRVASRLVDFHARAQTNPEITWFGGLETARKNTEENFGQTEKYVGITVSREKYRVTRDYAFGFLERNVPLFERRMREGRIRDCHGDLHAAHVCFTEDICIFDCIEFNDRFRYSDVTGDVSFLAMDLEYNGRADLARVFVDTYVSESSDRELLKLLNFFKCYRAYVRGKVESFKLDDPLIPEEEKARVVGVAARYFDLAYSYAIRPSRPTLFVTVGLIGTGKSTLAERLAKEMGLEVVSSDVVRKTLAKIEPTERRYEQFDSGIYSREFSRKTYDELCRQAKQLLAAGESVVLDASFRKAEERQKARALARELGADFRVLECVSDETAVKERLAVRQNAGNSVSDGRLEILSDIKNDFEPLSDIPDAEHIVVDTSGPIEETIAQAIHKIVAGVM